MKLSAAFRLRFLMCAALIAAATLAPPSKTQERAPDYKNPRLPVERRVADLLGRMTLEEKVAQLVCLWAATAAGGAADRLLDRPRRLLAGEGAAGDAARHRADRPPARAQGPARGRALRQRLAEVARREHAPRHPRHLPRRGSARPDGAEAARTSRSPSRSPAVGTRSSSRASSPPPRLRRARAAATQVLGPNLDLAREPRWGRTEETYGEDPYLVSRMGVAVIKALQGQGPGVDDEHVIATAKHFAAHGQPEGGTNIAPANYSERVLREVLPAELRGGRQGGGRVERDGLLQRDRRRALARQPLAAREGAAAGVGLRRPRRLRLLRHPAVGEPAPRRRRQGGGGAARDRGGRGHRAARPRLLPDARAARQGRQGLRGGVRPGRRAEPARQVPARPLREPLR